MKTTYTVQFIGLVLVGITSVFTPAFAGDGVQPQKLANILYGKSTGDGYQGTFFIKSPELIEISNKMLKKAGVQYTLSQDHPRKMPTYVTAEEAYLGKKSTPQTKADLSSNSFSDVNQQVSAQPKSPGKKKATSLQGSGLLFTDVADSLHQ